MTFDRKLYKGVSVHILGGDTYANQDFILTTPDPINVGVDDITFEIMTRAATGNIAPAYTPLYIGQLYIDTSAKKAYVSVGATSGDWIEI